MYSALDVSISYFTSNLAFLKVQSIYCFVSVILVASEVHVLEYCFNLIPRFYITNRAGTNE
jgi:hypothetical protein